MDVPEVHFAPSGDLSIAYQRFGSGPEVVAVPPFAQNIEVMWEEPHFRAVLERMGSFSTFTHLDKRGTGLSDRSIGRPNLEERMDDFRAVMDHCGIERATLVAASEGGPMAMLFAATCPARVEKLVLFGTFAAAAWIIDPELSFQKPLVEAWVEALASNWGTTGSIATATFMPSMLGDAAFGKWMQRYERSCLTPKSVRELMELNLLIDVRGALEFIQAPTLVFHRRDDRVTPLESGRYVAEHIAGAQLVELDGIDHVPWFGDMESWLGPFQDFVIGGRASVAVSDRVLATVLFTDIVGSTSAAAQLGDHAWRQLLDRHDAAMRAEITRFSGREVKTTGDGFLATFDSPGRAVRAAAAMTSVAERLGCPIRAGVHTGEVEMRGPDVAGMAVHIGARVGALAQPSEVLVTSTVRDLVIGSELRFEDRGAHALKGVEGNWTLLAAVC